MLLAWKTTQPRTETGVHHNIYTTGLAHDIPKHLHFAIISYLDTLISDYLSEGF